VEMGLFLTNCFVSSTVTLMLLVMFRDTKKRAMGQSRRVGDALKLG
jgi:hypothetical protein